MNHKILLVFAHPDDESFTVGGTIAKYASEGSRVELLCATPGQLGERGLYDETVDLAAIRSQELEEAGKILGISAIEILEYKDGKLSKIEPGELEDKIYKTLVSIEPEIVITFEPNGISNHPDHKKISLATTYAFQKYAVRQVKGERLGSRDPRRQFAQQLPPSTIEPKLYYACMPNTVAEFLKKHKVIPQESFDKPWVGVPDKMVTTIIDIDQFTMKKLEALSKHKTQQQDAERFVSIDNQPLMFKEYFILRMQGEEEVFMGNNDQVSDSL